MGAAWGFINYLIAIFLMIYMNTLRLDDGDIPINISRNIYKCEVIGEKGL
jgi:hypothetical protein